MHRLTDRLARHCLKITLIWAFALSANILLYYLPIDPALRRLAPALTIILALIAGLFAWIKSQVGLVRGPEAFTRRTKLPVIGAIHRMTQPRDDDKWENLFAASLDHLVIALRAGHISKGRKCLLITSAISGEGKTTLAAHLAARFSHAGLRTLLIDGDLRRKTLSRRLDILLTRGLADILWGGHENAMIPLHDFFCLSGGSLSFDPASLLHSTRLTRLLAECRERFDVILIDTPPVLPVADALIIGQAVDGALLATFFGRSRLEQVERTASRLASVEVPLLGVVINAVKKSDPMAEGYLYDYGEETLKAWRAHWAGGEARLRIYR